MSTRKVFIAGAGPVGLAAAIEMTRRGCHVRIVDPDSAPSPQSRALFVNHRTLDLLEPAGVSEALIALGNKVRHIVFRRNNRVLAAFDLSAIPHKHKFMLALSQSRLEQVLADRLLALGVKLERNLGVSTFAAGRKLEVSLSDGTSDTADVLLGADGSHSTIRKVMGLGFPGETASETFGLADVTLQDWPFPFDTGVLTILDSHLAPFIPLAEGFGRFITTRGACLDHLPADATVRKVEWETDFRISYRQVETYQQDNVFLSGDAAHIHSPVGGRGMNLGIEDACWLAWLIEQGRESSYSSLRHPQGARVLRYTQRFTNFVRSRGFVQDVALRAFLPAIACLPALQRRVFPVLTGLDTPHPPWLPLTSAHR